MQNLTLSRGKLETFLRCQRRFQLRYVTKLPWPEAPVAEEKAAALLRGSLFHQMVERDLLGMPEFVPEDIDPQVLGWWQTFKRHRPKFPSGDRFPEASMTVAVNEAHLFGRFDLLITSDDTAHLYDWKTERFPRSEWQLREDWQTKLYLALIVEGADALGRGYKPDDVAITYWFAEAPEQSVTIRYSTEWHRQNWAEIRATIGRIERRLAAVDAIWPLTDDLRACATCGYRAFCGREAVAEEERTESELERALEDSAEALELEPEFSNRF